MADTAFDILKETDDEFKQVQESERVVPPSPAEREPAAEHRPLAEPAPASPNKDDAPKEEQPKHHVPLATYLEEQKERKRLERLHAEYAVREARIEERLRILNERFAGERQPQETAPDKASDPVGYLEWQIKQVKNEVTPAKQLDQRLSQWETAQRMSLQVQSQEQAFAKATPDYWDALEHVSQVRLNQYKMLMPEEQAAQAVARDANMWAQACLAQGKNPAEATYELAKTYGYQAKAPVQNGEIRADSEPARNPDGTFAKQVNPKVEKAKENLKTVARGTEQKSLAAVAGTSPNTELTIEDLATMSDEDFDRATSGKKWKQFWANA